ncbi:MAG TPA: DUF2927 domain-containing protein [Alphaproteobacteria bacterium]|jgi:hypothetical protein
MRRLALLAAPLIVLAGGALGESRSAWPNREVLARQFERIAFTSEFGGENRAGRLIRWSGPIRVRLAGHMPDRFRAEVERQLAELRALSGLAIEIAGEGAEGLPPALTVEFSNSRGGTTFDPEAPCRTLIWETGHVIRKVQIYIAPYPDLVRRHCIAEELTQALGLADDSPLVRDSIFNDASARQRLAPWDALMVRILYDPRLRPGMLKAEAMPVVRRIIAEHLGRGATSSSRPR